MLNEQIMILDVTILQIRLSPTYLHLNWPEIKCAKWREQMELRALRAVETSLMGKNYGRMKHWLFSSNKKITSLLLQTSFSQVVFFINLFYSLSVRWLQWIINDTLHSTSMRANAYFSRFILICLSLYPTVQFQVHDFKSQCSLRMI